MIYFLLENGADPNISGELNPIAHMAKFSKQSDTGLSTGKYAGLQLNELH